MYNNLALIKSTKALRLQVREELRQSEGNMESLFDVIEAGNGHIIKAWKRGVPFEEQAIAQLKNTASVPFLFKHLAAMTDCHLGVGATIGTVLPTKGACGGWRGPWLWHDGAAHQPA